MTTQLDTLTVEREGPLATVTLDRPAVFNAFNSAMRAQLLDAVEALNADPQVRIVILKGSGPGFCAGADLTEGMPQSITLQIENEYKPFLTAIAYGQKLWMAAIHGSAAGIGGALAMACDLAVMEEDANIYLAFAAIGLVPDGGATWQLLQAMGHKKAMETVIEGRKIPASQCLEYGLVNKVVPKGDASAAAREWALRLCDGAPLAQAAAKRALRQAGRLQLEDAISLEAQLQQDLIASEDFRNGVAAFLAKRKPEFRGK